MPPTVWMGPEPVAVVEGTGVVVGATTGVVAGVVSGGGGAAVVGVVAGGGGAPVVGVVAGGTATVEPSTGFVGKVVTVWGSSS